jgi:8-oxo-dGTP pyrophosphatase MutT (NUDIX family)
MDIDKHNDRKWKVLESEYLIERPWLTARRDKVELPNGVVNNEFYVLEYPDWVNVIAITEDGMMVMERQYRHGLRWTGYEICAGVVEEGEQPEDAAKRELMEETGFGGGTWTKVMTICGNPSCTNNLTHCFIATGVKRMSSPNLEKTEDITTHIMSPEEVYELLVKDEIRQALMAAPLWRYFALTTAKK